ncbi:hypothetical protein Dform_00856 [Dehalogenimonas formicexedens]|uniref:Uncharacterized protein n=1 Tax=Dehalogenimonas formicexedens TaxID=1839801 RepID=A0A1P8F6U2_9CHLR|nr:hypothetical protein [Dehalogenimonas formicexedens]APV44201.1 hypothetical protein Dform_00856 [Dehalogenimonas formicexedens]
MITQVLPLGVTPRSVNNLKQFRDKKTPNRPGDYRGAFASGPERIIRELIGSSDNVLHLYSGRSTIGRIRVDLECEEATLKMSVEKYISSCSDHFEWCLLDPPYQIKDHDNLKEYADARALSGNALFRDRIRLFFREHVDNVLYLDYCSPTCRGFSRAGVWAFLPGYSWQPVRCLTWLKRQNYEMSLFDKKDRPAPIVAGHD